MLSRSPTSTLLYHKREYNMPASFQICKCEPNVCQLRLDFVNFTIAGPDDSRLLTGSPSQRTTCNMAQFTATSDGVAVPVICGENSGYHSE